MTESKFWRHRRLIRESTLTIQERWVISLISEYEGDHGACVASMNRLAVECDLSEKRLWAILNGLRQQGYITVKRRQHLPSELHICWKQFDYHNSQKRDISDSRHLESELQNSCFQDSELSDSRRLSTYRTPKVTPKRTQKVRSADSGEVLIPESLNASPKFLEAWAEWRAYRRERRLTMTRRTLTSQLAVCAEHGPDTACEMIRASITSGWQGLFPPREKSKGKINERQCRTGTAYRHDPNAGPADTNL